MLNIGKRVRRIEDGALGTVTKCGQFSFVHVKWDDGTYNRYSPMMVNGMIEEVSDECRQDDVDAQRKAH